ncbi:hypothetical protein PG991_001707 [Apiospora marii]|uniref:Uncharacterized protein n=1 Tax=Apiospora marii TaxID=335849 RepID=A0ABR1SQG4_9PEZI
MWKCITPSQPTRSSAIRWVEIVWDDALLVEDGSRDADSWPGTSDDEFHFDEEGKEYEEEDTTSEGSPRWFGGECKGSLWNVVSTDQVRFEMADWTKRPMLPITECWHAEHAMDGRVCWASADDLFYRGGENPCPYMFHDGRNIAHGFGIEKDVFDESHERPYAESEEALGYRYWYDELQGIACRRYSEA